MVQGTPSPLSNLQYQENLQRNITTWEEVDERGYVERNFVEEAIRIEDEWDDRHEVRRAVMGLGQGESDEDLPQSIFPWRRPGWRTPSPTGSMMSFVGALGTRKFCELGFFPTEDG